MQQATPKRGRGRPRAAAPEQISDVAFRLFEELGYAQTTMADVAAAAGVSAPTLFRYFPTKAAILWHRYTDSVARFRGLLDETPAELPLLEAIFSAYGQMLVAQRGNLPLIKARIALVSRESGGVAAAWDSYEQWTGIVVAFVARRRGVAPTDLEAVVLGGMIWAALWAAVVHWSHSADDEPAGALLRARRLCESAL